jgi:hypothetical protein
VNHSTYHGHPSVESDSSERLEGLVCQRRHAHSRTSFGWLTNPTTTQVRSLGTESTNINRRKASLINTDAIGMEPIIARFTKKVSQLSKTRFPELFTYQRIIKPSLSGLPQTHRVVTLFVLDGVAPPSGSVIVVGDILVEEL